MDQKERRALDRCFESLLHDLDPSPSFLHSLYAENILTEEQMDKISKICSRETQVATMLRFLPHRGPNAFSVFKDKLEKDYPWIAQKLSDELKKLQSGQAIINKRLISVIETQLVPLIYLEGTGHDPFDEKAHPGMIIQKLGDLLTNLELKCHKALDVTVGKHKIPINKLIDERLEQEKKKATDGRNLDDLKREIKDLKKQVRETAKLKGENDRLRNVVLRQKEKLKDYNKMTRDCKRHKQDMEKFKKETEMLRYEVVTLRDQLRSNITDLYA